MKIITQEAPMGCAIACAASLVGLSYKKMRLLFSNGETRDYSTGFYNRDIVQALDKAKLTVKTYSIRQWGNKKIPPGTIVFIGPSPKYLAGHYLLKTKQGWMNPWINSPNINPAKGGFQKKIPGKIRWLITKVL